MSALEDVVAMLPCLEKPPGEGIPPGLGQADLDAIENRIGFRLPNVFRTWLMITNGPCVGPGGVVGVNTVRKLQDLEAIYELYPNWKTKRWIPVAGDGCGNYYVLVYSEHELEPIVFVDVMENPDEPAFIAASDLWHFLDFLFRSEIGKSGWPFSEAEVVQRDPKIVETAFVLPWNA